MALYHASTKSLSRSAGRSAVAAAAYRTGTVLLDARQGLRHDYRQRRDVLFAEVITPDGEAVDREVLWNAAEAAEKRKDARTAREWELALPAELPGKEQRELAWAFGRHLVERYGVAVDLAMHAPHGYGDERNVHVHLLCTTRKFGRLEGGAPLLGEKVSIELSDSKKKTLGLPKTDEEIKDLRRVWAELTNGWLERNGIEARVDHRSHAERGIDREPTFHLGPEASAMERDGVRTRIGEENREIVEKNAERERQEEKERRLAQEIEALEGERERLQGIREAALARQARRDVEAIRGRWEARTREKRRRRILERAQDRHANRDHTHDARLWTQMRWQGRQWEREQRAQLLKEERRLAAIEANNEQTAQEGRPGIRHPERGAWYEWRQKKLTEAYNAELAEKLARWVKVSRGKDQHLHLRNAQVDIVDRGDRVVARKGGTDREIEVLVEVAKAKGWQSVALTGSAEFQEKAGRAFLEAGLQLVDRELQRRIEEQRTQVEQSKPQQAEHVPQPLSDAEREELQVLSAHWTQLAKGIEDAWRQERKQAVDTAWQMQLALHNLPPEPTKRLLQSRSSHEKEVQAWQEQKAALEAKKTRAERVIADQKKKLEPPGLRPYDTPAAVAEAAWRQFEAQDRQGSIRLNALIQKAAVRQEWEQGQRRREIRERVQQQERQRKRDAPGLGG